ncbi:membrane-targeted effector domain-containing toxin [Pseudomonas sp. HMWF021]|uniref:membrane-targeted effector domain-containing toxin n=1 Tax=Pseudomonas sp. HMWF021 TaxID=2056857 RepID=UPI000D37C746|nr:membrane-targeted effector domain-containing toxin [Pseudomonas sp. HMWF021]PTT30090.1 toxin [Pseudomonas sp. HMWF021]
MNLLATQTRTSSTDQQALEAVAKSLVLHCPSLQDSTHQVAADLLARHDIHDLDPDKVYFHRFKTTAASNEKTFTGWDHTGPPYESLTLTQLVIHRFRATDFDNADLLDLYGGFYSAGPEAKQFDETNEVRLHGNDVLKAFWSIDFSSLYRQQLDTFWQSFADDFRTLAKCNFLIKALEARSTRTLSSDDFSLVVKSAAFGQCVPVTLQSLRDETIRPVDLQVAVLDIDGHEANQALRIVMGDGRQILYLTGSEPSFITFQTPADLHLWVLNQFNGDVSRQALLTHFPLAARQQLAQNLTEVMNRMVAGWGKSDHSMINRLNRTVSGDAFTWLRDSTRSATWAEADLSLTSNGDLRKKLWIGYLSAGLKVFGPLAAVGWPVALPVIGASVASMGLNIDQAVNGRTSAERKSGVIGAILSGINALFNAPFLKGSGALTEAGTTLDNVEATEMAQLLEDTLPAQTVESTEDAILSTSSETATLSGAFHSLPPAVEQPVAIPQAYQSNELLEGLQPIADSGKYQGIYRLNSDPPFAVLIGDDAYYVRYFPDSQGGGYWAIVDPVRPNQFIHSLPVRLNAAGQWERIVQPGLKGGGQCVGKQCVMAPDGEAAEPPYDTRESDFAMVELTGQASSTGESHFQRITTPFDIRGALRDSLRDWALDVPQTHMPMRILTGAVPAPDLYAIHCLARFRQLALSAAEFYREFHWTILPPRPPVPALTTTTTFPELIASALENAPGLVIGETLDRLTSLRLMIENMPILARHGVTTLYVRGLLNDFTQTGLNQFFQNGNMSEELLDYLLQLNTDPAERFNLLELVRAGRRTGIRIQATDCAVTYKASTAQAPNIEQMTTSYLTNEIMLADRVANPPGKWVVLTSVDSVNTHRNIAGISELQGGLGVRVEEVAPGNGSRVAIDPGIEVATTPDANSEFQGDLEPLRADLRVQVEAPWVNHNELQTARLLRRRGMYLFERSQGAFTLVHRSSNQMIVRTPVQVNLDGSLSINRPSWAVHQQRYANIAQLSQALQRMGMVLQSRLPD